MQRLQPNFTTDGLRNFIAQQKQRKQPILTDEKNIFTYCFQPIQLLQRNFKTAGIRSFIYTKQNGDNAKKGYSVFYCSDNVYHPILWIIHTKQPKNQFVLLQLSFGSYN